AEAAPEPREVSDRLDFSGYVRRPPLRGDAVLLGDGGHGRIDQGAQLERLALQLVALLVEPLDDEEVLDQPAHPPQRAQARIHHLLALGSRALRSVHALEEVARPERGRQRVLDLVGDEAQVLAASIAGGHPRNVVRPAGARKEPAGALYRLARLPILKFLPVRRPVHCPFRRQQAEAWGNWAKRHRWHPACSCSLRRATARREAP